MCAKPLRSECEEGRNPAAQDARTAGRKPRLTGSPEICFEHPCPVEENIPGVNSPVRERTWMPGIPGFPARFLVLAPHGMYLGYPPWTIPRASAHRMNIRAALLLVLKGGAQRNVREA